MQARILSASLSAIALLAFSTGAAAQQRVNSREAEQQTSVQGPYQLQAQPQEAHTGYLKIEGLDGEALMPEQPICAHCGSDILSGGGSSAPREQISLNYEKPQAANEGRDVAAPQDGQAALIVPAIQRSRDPHAAPAPRDPELPICGHCGADAQAEPSAAPQRRRGGFSLSIGGVTVGSGGVSVAVGDVDGDSAPSASRPARPAPAARPARASSSR